MNRLTRIALCLLVFATLAGCTQTYDDLVYPGKIYEPGAQ